MLRHDLVPTPLILPTERGQLPTLPTRPPRRFATLASLYHLARLGYLLLTMKIRHVDVAVRARRVREFLEQRAGIWVKVGQVLATRRDAFAPDYCTELEKLQDRMSTFPADESLRIIEEDLGVPIGAIFSQFDKTPVAAASVSQIHRAWLRERDCWVAVKVRRPYIAEIFRRDVALIRRLVSVLGLFGQGRHAGWREMIDELERMLLEETDLRIEAGSIHTMRRTVRNHASVYVPMVFAKYCSERVLVMEWISGVVMSDFLKVQAADRERAEEWLKANGINPKRVARTVFTTVYRQIHEDNIFHADLHPGNLMLLREGKVALIDFGSVGSLPAEFLRRLMLYNQLLAECEYNRATAVLLSMSAPLPPTDIDRLIHELVQIQKLSRKIMASPAFTYEERARLDLVGQQTRVMNKYKVPVSWEFLRMTRTHTAMEISLRSLDPDINYTQLSRRIQNRRARREQESAQARTAGDARDTLQYFCDLVRRADEEAVARGDLYRMVRVRDRSPWQEVVHTLRRTLNAVTAACALVLLAQRHAQVLPAALGRWLASPLHGLESLFADVPRPTPLGWVATAALLLWLHLNLRRVERPMIG